MATKVRTPWDKFRAKKADESGNGGGILVVETGQEQKGEANPGWGLWKGGVNTTCIAHVAGESVSLTE